MKTARQTARQTVQTNERNGVDARDYSRSSHDGRGDHAEGRKPREWGKREGKGKMGKGDDGIHSANKFCLWSIDFRPSDDDVRDHVIMITMQMIVIHCDDE